MFDQASQLLNSNESTKMPKKGHPKGVERLEQLLRGISTNPVAVVNDIETHMYIH